MWLIFLVTWMVPTSFVDCRPLEVPFLVPPKLPILGAFDNLGGTKNGTKLLCKGNNGNSPRPRQFSPRPSPLLLRVRKLLPAERTEEEEERGERGGRVA